METLQKAVGEIRKDLEQKKKESTKPDGAVTAGNSTPNLSPAGGSSALRCESRTGTGIDWIMIYFVLTVILIRSL